jgi:hypothetical protein
MTNSNSGLAMGNVLFSLAGIVLMAFACQPKKDNVTADCLVPSGRYINTTVLDQCGKSMPSDIPHFCFEFNFKRSGSVDVDNGFEKFSLPYTAEGDGCRFKISGASLFGDMYFVLNADSSLQLIDTSWTKISSFSVFKKIKGPDGSDMSFEYYLNDCLVTGEYAVFKNGNLSTHQVTFMPNGQMNGLKPFLGYAICYAGDCLEETDPAARTIDLIDEKGDKETFVFKNVEGKMAIELYSIGPPIPDMKGGRSIGPMIYELRTE